MAGQKEEEKKPEKPKKKPYWEAVRSTKKKAGPTVEEAGKGIGMALLNLLKPFSLWPTDKKTMVKGAIRKKKTY